MSLLIPNDNSFEQAVKAVVQKNYPQMASRGLLNITIQNTTASTGQSTDRESGDENAKQLFFWGTSMWGGKRVVL